MSKPIQIVRIVPEDSGASLNSINSSPDVKPGAERVRERLNAFIDPSDDVQKYLPIIDIKDGIVLRRDGTYVKIIEIDPKGFSKLTAEEKNRTIDNFIGFLSNAPKDFHIKIVTEKTDANAIIEAYASKISDEPDPYVRVARRDNLSLVRKMSSDEAQTKRYFLSFEYTGNIYSGKQANNLRDIASDIRTQVDAMDVELRECGNSVIRHTDENRFTIETLYRLLNRKSCQTETVRQRVGRLETDLNDYSWYLGSNGNGYVSAPPSSIIAPRGIDPHYDYIIVDGLYYSYVAIKENGYRIMVNAGWITNFATYGWDVDIFFSGQKTDDIENRIQTSMARKMSTLNRTTERANQHQLSNTIGSADWIMSKLENDGENFYYCTCIITVCAESYDRLVESRGKLLNFLNHSKMKGEKAGALIEEYFKSTLPLCNLSKAIYDKHRRNMTTQGVASCYPFDEQRLRDEDGIVIGTSTSGRALALYNPFDTNRYRNANMLILGPSGSGKTYTSLMLARRLRMAGIKVMMVLPLKGHEYRKNVDYLGGEFIRLSGGSDSCINLFDINAAADLDAQKLADLDVTAKSNLQQKIVEVNTFIELLLNRPEGLSAAVSSSLEVAIADLYQSFGITEDNQSLFNADGTKKRCPTIGDFYEHIKDNPDLSEIRQILLPFISGALKNLNGQTNVDMANKMIAFDVSEAGSKYQPIFFFLAVNLCYAKMRENDYEKSVLFMDEAWKLMDNPNSAEYVKEVVKIVRGYAGSAIIATQNLGDIYKKPSGAETISNLQTKLILQVDSGEKDIYRDVLRLTQRQIDRIGKQKAGELTMLANNELYEITTASSQLEFNTYTTDPNKVADARKYLEKYYEKALRKETETNGITGNAK